MKRKIRNGNIYAALGICAVAVAVAAVISSTSADKPDTQGEGFSRVSISWDESIFYETAPETDAVDIGVTGIPDARTEEFPTEREPLSEIDTDFAMPMGNDIIKDYSNGEMMLSKTMGDWRVHNGIDFTGIDSADIFAIQAGTVTKVYDDPMWGVVAEIDLGNTMTAKYCGLKSGTTVKKGDTVKKGEIIGKSAYIKSLLNRLKFHHLIKRFTG